MKKSFEERYKNLNDKQREAVETIDGPVLVVAGPGSGKTELLALRTANILKQTDILPSNILLLTFTEAASFNMRERLINLIGEEGYRVGIYTFHSFASDIINKYPEYFFDGAKFKPATEIDQINIIENILKSLPRKNPLSSKHPEQGFVYTRDIISSIRDLKKGGYTPELFAEKIKQNIKNLHKLKNIFNGLEDIAGKRKYSEVIETYNEIYQKLEKLKKDNDIAEVLYNTLEINIKKASIEEKSKFLTSWKNAYTQKIQDEKTGGKFILKDEVPERIEKMESLLGVYTEYQAQLYKECLYDFEDMILFAVEAFQKYPNLKADLQERFQYIMIDEFQDTNDSQFELILQLAKDVSNNGNANVLAVGDDDQAIYKFQGAKLNNIYSFVNNFPGRHVIVLDKNYRSTQEILDFARNVIIKAEDRLETRDININKKIKAENLKYLEKKVGEIKIEKFDSELHEFNFIGQELSKLLKQGIDPKEIAIICRKHEQLKNLANVLNNFRVPYSYSKRENILEKPHIHELITIIRFLCMQQDGDGDELLPEILSYKFWDLERIDIWRVAEKVRRGKEIETDLPGKTDWKRVSWIEAMHDSENKKLRDIANFLIKLTEDSRTTPIEFLLDEIIGTTEFLWEDSEYDDTLTPRSSPAKDFVSPYKKYYFNEKIFERNRPQYLDFLFSLRTFIGALREFSAEHILKAKNIMDFVEMYNGNHLTLSYVSPFSSSENAVSLLTAHSAKGLEFEYVFLLSADSSVWSRAGRSNKISFPINMPLTPEGENDDDKIRLLYVALTRAKHTLYITHSGNRVEFLASDDEETPPDLSFEKGREMEQMSQEFLNSFNLVPTREFVQDEKLLLKRLLENYKMPVTHLNNFLNFTRVGPSKFLENNILRFPQAKTPSSAYGSAMHDAVERYFLHFKKYGKVPDLDFVKSAFKNFLERSKLPKIEFEKYLESGYENLEIYISDLNKRKLLPNTKVETKFTSEDVVIGTCPITGNIDRMEFIDDKEVIVTDLKTGESYGTFEEKGMQDYEKIKLHFYKYQLAFYALLIENSKHFKAYKVKVANLEFLEADKNGKIVILPYVIDQEIKDRVIRLANIVCEKIHNLDFPDTSNYPQSYKGILQFEEDLLNEIV